MFFFEQTKRLWLEFTKFKRFRSFPIGLSILLGILVSPLMLIFVLMMFTLFIGSIIYSLLSSPIEYLHKILKDEIKEKHVAVQVVLYLISWGVLFALYFIFAFFSFYLFILYFFTSVIGWLASLSGYKFHILANEENIELDIPVHVKKEKASKEPKEKKKKKKDDIEDNESNNNESKEDLPSEENQKEE